MVGTDEPQSRRQAVRSCWPTLVVLGSCALPACGKVAEASRNGSEGGAHAGGQPSSGASANTGAHTGVGGRLGAAGQTPGGAPPREGCFGVDRALSSAELNARVEKRLGLRIASEEEVPGATPKARGLRLTETIDGAMRESGPPPVVRQLLHDFVRERLLFETDAETGERRIAPFDGRLAPELGDDMGIPWRRTHASSFARGTKIRTSSFRVLRSLGGR